MREKLVRGAIEILLIFAILTFVAMSGVFSFSGCAPPPRKPIKAEIVLPRACLEKVELLPGTECRVRENGIPLCGPLKLTKLPHCEVLEVPKAVKP